MSITNGSAEKLKPREDSIDGKPLTIEGMWSAGYQTMIRNWAACFIAAFCSIVTYILPGILYAIALLIFYEPLGEEASRSMSDNEKMPESFSFLQFLGLALPFSMLFVMFVSFSVTTVNIADLASGESLRIWRSMKVAFRQIHRLVAVALLLILIMLGMYLAGGVLADVIGGQPFVTMLGNIALGWVMVLWMSRLCPSMPALIDGQARTLVGAVRLSWGATRGLGQRLTAVCFLAWLAGLASALLFGVGFLLIGLPLWAGVLGATYAMLRRDRFPAVGLRDAATSAA